MVFEPYGERSRYFVHTEDSEPLNCPYLILSIVSPFDWPSNMAVGLTRAIRLVPASVRFANMATRVGPRENGDLIRPTKTARGGTYFVPSSLQLGEVRPEKAILSARPHAFRAASGLTRVDYGCMLHSSTFQHSLTLAISQCARINPC